MTSVEQAAYLDKLTLPRFQQSHISVRCSIE